MSRPARPWFRFYVEAFGDPKILRLEPAERWVWVAVLGAARASCEPGRLLIAEGVPMTVSELAHLAGVDTDATFAALQKMRTLGMIAYSTGEGGLISVCRWADRQYESDDVTRRTARHRSKEQDSADLGTFPSRSQERPNHVPGNGPDTDTETDTETEREGAISQTKSDPPTTKRRKAGTPIPSPFFVSEANIAWVGTKCPGLDWDRETQKLVAWAKAGDKRYVDWDAAWKNWMLKAAERKPW